jgi:hypothetical protein
VTLFYAHCLTHYCSLCWNACTLRAISQCHSSNSLSMPSSGYGVQTLHCAVLLPRKPSSGIGACFHR